MCFGSNSFGSEKNMEYTIMIILVVSLTTIFTRVLPFWIFRGKEKLPDTVMYIGKVLPPAIMVILVVYCLRGINILMPSEWIPDMMAVIVVAALHIWKKNTLLSISVGTIFYMIMVQKIF